MTTTVILFFSAPTPECPPVCLMFCEHGNQKDENGCDICACNDAPGKLRLFVTGVRTWCVPCKSGSVRFHERPQKFFQRGAKPPTVWKVDTFSARRTKNRPFFGAPMAETKFFAFLRRFRLKYSVSMAIERLRRERKFYGVLSDGSIWLHFFKFQGGASAPLPPSGADVILMCIFNFASDTNFSLMSPFFIAYLRRVNKRSYTALFAK